MIVIGAFLVVVLVFLFSGLGLSQIFVPEKYKNYKFLISPFLGCWLIEMIAQNLNVSGLPVGKSLPVAVFIVALSYIPWIVRMVRSGCAGKVIFEKNIFSNVFKLFLEKHLYVFIFSFFSAYILLYPLIELGYLTWFGGGTDSTGYIRYAYFLKNNALSSVLQLPESEYPWYGWVHFGLKIDWLGTSYILSFLSGVLSTDPFKVFNILMAFLGFLIPISVFLVSEICFKLDRKISILSAFLISCQSFIFVPGYTTFLNHFGAIPFFILLLGFYYFAIEDQSLPSVVLCGIFTSVLISFYSVILTMLVPVVFLYACTRCYKSFLSFKKLLIGILMIAVLPVLFNNFLFMQYFERGITVSAAQKNLYPSTPFFESPLQYLSFFLNTHSSNISWEYLLPYKKLSIVILNISVLLFFSFSFFYIDKKVKLYYILISLFFALFFFVPLFQNYWYGLWKVMTYIQFFVVLGVSVTLSRFLTYENTSFKKLVVNFFIISLFLAVNVDRGLKLRVNPHYICDKNIVELVEIGKFMKDKLNDQESLGFLFPQNPSPHEWLSVIYMLKDVKISIKETQPEYQWFFFTNSVQKNDLKAKYLFSLLQDSSNDGKIVWSNARYKISEIENKKINQVVEKKFFRK